jgi:UDP-3-O-[3-hydroxymyristoyl] glucosamine N-acyltransferase
MLNTADIAALVAGDLQGPGDLTIDGVETVELASPSQLTFIGDAKFAQLWPPSQARAALVKRGLEASLADPARALILVDDVDAAMALVQEKLAPPPVAVPPGVHPSAVVDPSAALGQGVCVGPLCYVGPRVVIGDGTTLHSGVHLHDEVRIGAQCVLWSGTVIRERCTIGDRCIFHPNVTIGADGFGYRPAPGGRGILKIPQIGIVTIGHDVEIGAGTCIDRGRFSATTVGDMTKIDNLVQIGHNCRIGRCVVISGQTAIAGTVTIGDGALLGGMCAIKDHVTIGPGVKLAGCAAVMGDIPAGETWAGYPARDMKLAVIEQIALKKLPQFLKDMKRRD